MHGPALGDFREVTGVRRGLRTRRWLAVIGAIVATGVAGTMAWAAEFGVVPSPNPGTSNTIDGLVAFSPTTIWAIGTASSPSYASCHGRTLTAQWDGSAFTEVPSTATAICASIGGVAGTSTADIWAVGSVNEGRDTHIRHWDGASWMTVPGADIPLPPSGGRTHRSTGLNAVAALSPINVWAVGRAQFADFSRHTLIEHWNGSSWQLVSGPTTPSVLYGIAALNAEDIWAVGASGADTLAIHWDGSDWTTVASPNANVNNTLRGVAAVASNDVWAVGSSFNASSGASVSQTLVEHWDGSSWTVVPSPNVGSGANALLAVATRPAGDVWAVGYYVDVTGDIPVLRTLVLSWDGVSWTRVASANVGTGDNKLTAVVAPAGTDDVWASGGSASGTLVERWAGRSGTPTAVRLVRLTVRRGHDGVAVNWRTASEAGLLGFNLYRQTGRSSRWTRVNRSLIRAAGHAHGGRYSRLDRTAGHAGPCSYRLTAVALRGEETSLGTRTVIRC